ncbi:hypothetical protein [Actinospongicola halichondriae]|uniref:hypothetical protein n=1 Tax=Actinospongicola halichondriae TaxID=3236844 RepID=UPI003D5047BF
MSPTEVHTDRPRSTPWMRIIRFALVGTVLMTLGVFVDLEDKGGHVVGLIQPGDDGPSAAVFAEDFPDLELPDGLGHDGQQFYVIARSPMHLDEISDDLDRPQYRLQRPVYPVLSWMLHPSGGGEGLVIAMAVVGIVAIFLAGLGAGALSTRLGGGTWPALLVPLLPGTYAAMRLSLADTLALAFVLIALAAIERNRADIGVVAAVLGVFTKESLLVVLVGHALFRRTRASIVTAVTASLSTAAWWVALRVLVDADSEQVIEFTWPFGGVIPKVDEWVGGTDWIAGVTVVGAFLLAASALWVRGRRHPLFGALAAVTAFSVFLGPSVLGLDFNGPRTIGPMLVLAILTWGTPTPVETPDDAAMADVAAV